jgi:hypothetical protein
MFQEEFKYQFFSENVSQKISELILMCTTLFLSPEMHALCMEKCLHLTLEMHTIYLPHEIQKTNLKWSRHNLQLMEYKFLQIVLWKTLHNKRLDLLIKSLLALFVQPLA